MSRPAAGASGARSGALLTVASAASIAAAYVFLLAAGRILGSEDYGSLAALLGVLAVVVIPAGALQMALSREVSRRVASGDAAGAAQLTRGTLVAAGLATLPLLVVAFALAVPLDDVLHIHSVGLVALAATSLATAFVFPVATGALQGLERFHALATLYVFPWLVRLAVLAIAAAAGYRLGGALFATVAGALASTALAVFLIREPLRAGRSLPRGELVAFLGYLWPVAIGLVGIALLTHVDVLIVKARFSGDEAGAYAAASAFARVGFFLPATILAVLFPRTAARQARGEETEDILGRSLLATAAFCGLVALVYAAAGRGLVSMTFGTDFAEGGDVLAPFAVAVGLFSLANVLVGYHLSRGETRYAWLVGAAVFAQVAALALIPSSLAGVVWTNVAVGAGLLVAHELLVGSSVPALHAALRHVSRVTRTRIRHVTVEAFAVFVASTVFVCALMWPVAVHLSSAIVGYAGSDSTGSIASLWALAHESGFHVLGTTHHTLTGAPFGWDEGNGLNVQVLLPYYPGYLLTKVVGAIAAYNLVMFAGYVLTAAAMYLLTRYLGCSRLVAAWAGLVTIVFPWHLARAEHASLTHLEVLVLLLLALVAVTRRPTPLRFALVGLATLACWLTSGYFGAMAVIVSVAFGVGAALPTSRRRALLLVGGTTAAAVVPMGVMALSAYAFGGSAGRGISRAPEDLASFGLRPLELVVPAARHLIFGGGLDAFWAKHAHGSNAAEFSNYLGLLTIALAVAWLVVVVRRRIALGATAGLVASFVVAFLFALPSPVAGIPMPSRLLWEFLPGFRVPSRWDAFLMTALVPLAALGLQVLVNAVARGALVRAALVGAAMVISFTELAIHPPGHFRTVPIPLEYAAVKDVAPAGILAEYPLGYSDVYRLRQLDHGRPIVNGAPTGTTANDARLVVLDPAERGTAQTLALLGVTTIVIHPPGPVADVPVEPRRPTSGYQALGRSADGTSVWTVDARPAPALVLLRDGFGPPERLADGRVAHPLVASSGVVEVRAKAPGVVRLTFDLVGPSVRLEGVRLRPGHVALLVRVPRGVSRLELRGPATAVRLTTPRAAPAAGEPRLAPVQRSPNPGF